MNAQHLPAIILHTMAVLAGLALFVFAFAYSGDGLFFALASGMGGSLAVYLAAQLSRIAIKDE
jgi:hypothetical protein